MFIPTMCMHNWYEEKNGTGSQINPRHSLREAGEDKGKQWHRQPNSRQTSQERRP